MLQAVSFYRGIGRLCRATETCRFSSNFIAEPQKLIAVSLNKGPIVFVKQ
jgi:hypothetical protein